MEIHYDDWTIVKMLGTGSFGSVYEIERKDFGVYKAALKVITIPQYPDEIREIRSSGMSEDSIADYYNGMVEDIIREFALMNKLKGTTNIVSYEDHKIIPHEGELGWDIYIRMELLTPLDQYLDSHPFGEEEIARLGIDICHALERCENLNIIHRDIKPGNIFVSDQGDFKLGDFGIARTVERTGAYMSRKGTYSYMSPEVYNGMDYGPTADLYSLGLVMYRLLNHNRTPFLPAYPEQIKFQDQEIALLKRIKGTPLTPPDEASPELGEIILKACAYEQEDRYQSAKDFCRALEHWMDEKKAGGAALPEETVREAERPAKDWKRRNVPLVVVICVAAAVIAVLLFVLLRQSSRDAEGEPEGAGVPVVEEPSGEVSSEGGSAEDGSSEGGSGAGSEAAGEVLIPGFYNQKVKVFTEALLARTEESSVSVEVAKKLLYDPEVKPGRIVRAVLTQTASGEAAKQVLNEGDSVEPGSTVTLFLCGVKIPEDIVGMALEKAQTALSGLSVDTVYQYNNSIPYGCVIRMKGADGTSLSPSQVLQKGTGVKVYVSFGPKPQETPAYNPQPAPSWTEPLPAPPDEG